MSKLNCIAVHKSKPLLLRSFPNKAGFMRQGFSSPNKKRLSRIGVLDVIGYKGLTPFKPMDG